LVLFFVLAKQDIVFAVNFCLVHQEICLMYHLINGGWNRAIGNDSGAQCDIHLHLGNLTNQQRQAAPKGRL
jgi:hypothetical protein